MTPPRPRPSAASLYGPLAPLALAVLVVGVVMGSSTSTAKDTTVQTASFTQPDATCTARYTGKRSLDLTCTFTPAGAAPASRVSKPGWANAEQFTRAGATCVAIWTGEGVTALDCAFGRTGTGRGGGPSFADVSDRVRDGRVCISIRTYEGSTGTSCDDRDRTETSLS